MSHSRPGLCYRCEWRAWYLEHKTSHRPECADSGKSILQCCLYMPVHPIALTRAKGKQEANRRKGLAKDISVQTSVFPDEIVKYWGFDD